jgi:hypothetical protein
MFLSDHCSSFLCEGILQAMVMLFEQQWET